MLALVGCVEQAEEKPTAEDMEYVKKNILSAAPTPQFPVNADFDGKVVYLGLDSSMNPIEPGKEVKLTHYWKVVTPPGGAWRTYTHVNGGPNNAGFINFDHGLVRGKYPPAQWKAGDIIKDEHSIRLPPSWSFDHAEVYVGLWKGQERMPFTGGQKDPGGRLLAASIPVKTNVKPPERKKYIVRKASKPIKIDGKLDEAAWKDAPSTGAFANTMTGGSVEPKTEAKLLWDNNFLYIAFENEDKDVWAKLDKRDDKLWQQEADEIMIDADKNGRTYVEFQVAPNNNVFDTYLPEYRKYEDTLDPKRKQYDWNSKIKTAVKVDGTLNKHDDQDKGWVAEIAIPLADVNGLDKAGAKVPPALGDSWRINMFRLDGPEGKPQTAAGWSPPLVGDFHALDKFGEIVFADDKGEVPAAKAEAKADEKTAEDKGDKAGKAERAAALKALPSTGEGKKLPASKKGKVGEGK